MQGKLEMTEQIGQICLFACWQTVGVILWLAAFAALFLVTLSDLYVCKTIKMLDGLHENSYFAFICGFKKHDVMISSSNVMSK